MDRTTFDKLVADTVKATADLLIAKGDEYAGNADRLANFKRNAIKNGQTVLQTWQVYWGKHIDSIHTYMARVQDEATRLALEEVVMVSQEFYSLPTEQRISAEVRDKFAKAVDAELFRNRINKALPDAMRIVNSKLSEPIEGRFHDNINYSFLCLALIKELRENGADVDTRSTPR